MEKGIVGIFHSVHKHHTSQFERKSEDKMFFYLEFTNLPNIFYNLLMF